MGEYMQRRNFIKQCAVAGTVVAINPATSILAADSLDQVRIGMIGVGLRGMGHLNNLLKRKDVRIPAVCDIDPQRIALAQQTLEQAGMPKAKVYQADEWIYQDLLAGENLDGVIIATPWHWHFPMAVDAMKAGIVPGVEVSGAFSVQECWDLVTIHEQTGTQLMLLENVCYRRDIMAVLNMINQGLFGELIHCRCGYQHDLREVKFEPGVAFGLEGRHESVWRTQHAIKRNGDIYPTHGLGPVATFLNINRGNRLETLTSMASKSRGLHNYIVEHGGADHPNAAIKFRLGDIVTTNIACANGETIVITHDTNLPRPYSLGFRVQGTRGIWMKDGDQLYFEGASPTPHEWESSLPYLEKYDHPLWQRYTKDAEGSGHGGMDFFVLNAFIESLKRGQAPPLDVYDMAAWRAVTPLSEISIAEGGEPQTIPDFTRGKWITRPVVFGKSDLY
jgi:predicted dehydrogenase